MGAKQLSQDIFIGVDGGATKSKVRIENSAGELLGQGIGGPANIGLSVENAWQSIYAAIDAALQSAGLSIQDKTVRFHAGMGLAGCEVKKAYEDFLKHPHPFASLKVVSDAYIACLGAHKGQDGSIIIIGTGVVGYQIDAGKTAKVSGWGFPYDDEGSGAWLGLEALRLTFQWLDHRIEKSPLVVDVFSFFNNDLDHLMAWANRANSTEYARLAPLVINHCQQEEPSALRLIKKAAHAIDRVHHALCKMQNKEPYLPCSLFGGIAPFIEPYLNESLRESLMPRELDAVSGAVILARENHVGERANGLSHCRSAT